MSRKGALPEYRLVVWGDAAVGKSALCFRWMKDIWVEEYDPGIEDAYRKEYTLPDGRNILLNVLDTAGREEMSANAILRSSYEASCYIFVYAIDRVATLSHLLIGIDLIKQHKMRKAPILAVGNKIDLETRQVEIAEAKEILMEKGVVDVMECSAKGSLNTKEVFDRAVQLVVSTGPVPTYTPKSKCALL